MVATLEAHRAFFATLLTATVGVPKSRLSSALAITRREQFLGRGPWKVFTGHGYIETPSDDAAFLYQDIVVAIDERRKINNGQPSLHALCMAALNIKEGDTIIHIGSGTGYYTAVLAELAGAGGKVFAYEIERELAQTASTNLSGYSHVVVYGCSGTEAPLQHCDVMYVNAGVTGPLDIWLDALRPRGRIAFPLTPDGQGQMPGLGGMLLITRAKEECFDAKFISSAMFIPCIGGRDRNTAERLAEAFKRDDYPQIGLQ